jgi:hypothetical protein
VTHGKFGDGTVVSEAEGKTTVQFDDGSKKIISSDYLEPTDLPARPGAPERPPSGSREETPREQHIRGQRRARRAASKEGIEARKKMGRSRLLEGEYDPFQDLLESDEVVEFTENKELPKDTRMHHTQQTSADPQMADVPEHIQPVTHKEHIGEHLGDPGKVPTAGVRGDVTTPKQPIYDPNAPEMQASRANPREPVGEGSLEEEGISETSARKSPNFRNLPRVRDPALRDIYDHEIRTPNGVFRHLIGSKTWVRFPN